MSGLRGVCVDSENAVASPSPRRLKALGVNGGRLVVVDSPTFYAYDENLASHGFKRGHVWTGTTFDGAADMATRARAIASQVKSGAANLIANEFNINGAASWPPGGDDAFVGVYNIVAPAIREVQPDAELWIGGLFSKPDILDHVGRLLPRLDPQPGGVDLHLYLETLEEIRAILTECATRFPNLKRGIWEWNDSTPSEVGPFVRLLDELTDAHAFIPWSTEQLAGELPGVIHKNRYTPQGTALRRALRRVA